ncbi:MAG: hypothetical protein LIO46_07150 [Clostridiales bacterium]|nr:hypothetical protein [Clostridiales bacterium]
MFLSCAVCVSMFLVGAAAEDPAATIHISTDQYDTLEEAVAAAQADDVITLGAGEVEVEAHTLKLLLPLSIVGVSMEQTKIILTSPTNGRGLQVGNEAGAMVGGTFNFENLSIVQPSGGDLRFLINIMAYNPDEPVEVNIRSCYLEAARQTAIAVEGTSNAATPDTQYYDLTVEDCVIRQTHSGNGYCIGSGLFNNNPNTDNCTVTIRDNTFYGSTGGSPYNIHFPNPVGSLTVADNVCYTGAGHGIKYVYTADNEVSITGNVFQTYENNAAEPDAERYALLFTNTVDDLDNPRSYQWATKLDGNDLRGMNVLAAMAADLEVLWFPDGQAVNAVEYNNNGDANLTDEGTRYARSAYGASTQFNESGVVLTDFAVEQNALTFVLDEEMEGADTRYFYNSESLSGAYTNSVTGLEDYWTGENTRHCSGSLAAWEEANAVTRWTFGEDSLETLEDTDGVIVAEDEVAKVTVNTLTGEIHVEPKALGTTCLNAYVGGGDADAIPNYKADTLEITVTEAQEEEEEEETTVLSESETDPEDGEPQTGPSALSTSQTSGPKTGDSAAWMVFILVAAVSGGCLAALYIQKRRQKML